MQLTDQEIQQSAENMNGIVGLYEAAASHKFGRVGNIVSVSHRYSDKNKLDRRAQYVPHY
jgi:hypothetical protein